MIEFATATGFALLYPHHISLYLLFISLLVIFVADLKYQIIPDSMIVLGVLGALWAGAHLIPAIGSFAFLYLLWVVTRGRGMGFGDVKLAFLMGLFLGFPGVVAAFYVAFLTGAAAAVILMIGRKKTWKSKIAFGPFLVLGTVAAWIWQPQIVALWRMFL
jgi:prepilin signal peptidase PulO-like enzyme (type II secretory pathway)